MESKWLKEALFAGMTSNAFKLGTVLTLGWFWMRLCGCSMLYRGSAMEIIDFDDILIVADVGAGQISPPGYLKHEEGTTYFYVIRRANGCGQAEHTLAAAVKLSIDADGGLVKPGPNSVFSSKVEQVANRIRLLWYYCPVEQKQRPVCFQIYYDGGTGQIDYEDPIAVIGYAGRRFYSFESEPLDEGIYLFAIRAADAGGMEDGSLAKIKVQVETDNPTAVDILDVEAL